MFPCPRVLAGPESAQLSTHHINPTHRRHYGSFHPRVSQIDEVKTEILHSKERTLSTPATLQLETHEGTDVGKEGAAMTLLDKSNGLTATAFSPSEPSLRDEQQHIAALVQARFSACTVLLQARDGRANAGPSRSWSEAKRGLPQPQSPR